LFFDFDCLGLVFVIPVIGSSTIFLRGRLS
jgi:hypothetical protein